MNDLFTSLAGQNFKPLLLHTATAAGRPTAGIKEMLLFPDDLAWIPKQGAIGKASARQAGLYKAIKALGLDVTTIAQSWPVADYGVKTIIPFADLEQSMK